MEEHFGHGGGLQSLMRTSSIAQITKHYKPFALLLKNSLNILQIVFFPFSGMINPMTWESQYVRKRKFSYNIMNQIDNSEF